MHLLKTSLKQAKLVLSDMFQLKIELIKYDDIINSWPFLAAVLLLTEKYVLMCLKI